MVQISGHRYFIPENDPCSQGLSEETTDSSPIERAPEIPSQLLNHTRFEIEAFDQNPDSRELFFYVKNLPLYKLIILGTQVTTRLFLLPDSGQYQFENFPGQSNSIELTYRRGESAERYKIDLTSKKQGDQEYLEVMRVPS